MKQDTIGRLDEAAAEREKEQKIREREAIAEMSGSPAEEEPQTEPEEE